MAFEGSVTKQPVEQLPIRIEGAADTVDSSDAKRCAREDEKPPGRDTVVEQKNDEKPWGFFKTLAQLLETGTLKCLIGCPTVSEKITRIFAFHPPKCTYSACLESDLSKEIECASKLENQHFTLKFGHRVRNWSWNGYTFSGHCMPFTVTTREKSVLMCIRFQPPKGSDVEIGSRNLNTCSDQVIIFAQPNGSDLGSYLTPDRVSLLGLANDMQTDLYMFDYSGYGLSSGCASEKNVYADVHAVYDHVRKEQPNKKICLIGFSLGTSAVTDLASLKPPSISGVVLIAPFTSGIGFLWDEPVQGAPHSLDRFTSAEKISDVDVPVLLIHGTRDKMISMDHSRELHRRLKHPVPPLFVRGADHCSVFECKATITRIYEFIRSETFVNDNAPSSGNGTTVTESVEESK